MLVSPAAFGQHMTRALRASTFFGMNFAPETALGLSIVWSLKTCVLSHLSAISSEKRFLGLKSKVVILLCAICSTCRRILGLILFFTPAFGLFDILNHWEAEKIPFRVRLNHAKQFGIKNSSVLEFRRKHKEVAMEMLYNLLANFIFSFCKLVPLWYTGIVYTCSSRLYLMINFLCSCPNPDAASLFAMADHKQGRGEHIL